MHVLSRFTHFEPGAEASKMLQRVFDRACLLSALPKRSDRSDHLARFLIDEFHLGQTDEECLLECALWFARRPSSPPAPRAGDQPFQRSLQGRGPADE